MNSLYLVCDYLHILILSAMPVIELRGAIPIGVVMGMTPIHSAILCYFGSMIPVPFLLIIMNYLIKFAKHYPKAEKLLNKITSITLKKVKHFDAWSFWGLLIFVAIPLPTTGVWTGSIASAILGMKRRISLPAIAIGNLIAAILITSGTSLVGLFF